MPSDVNEPLAAVNLVEPTVTGLAPEVAATAELLTDLIRAASRTPLPHILRPASVLREVVGVASSIERGGRKPPRTNDRTSLRTDVTDALNAVGDELRSALEPAYTDFLIEAAAIEATFDDRAAIVRLRTSAETLLERLRQAAAAHAAWRDLQRIVEVGGETLEVAHLRTAQLRELIEERGREWSAVEGRLWQAAFHGRFDECEAIVTEDAPRTATVAWFAFRHGDLPKGYQRVGQVQFFSHRAWPDAVVSQASFSGFPDFELPVELDEHALTSWVFAHEVPSPVYARVELTGPRATGERNPWAQHRPPLEWARDLVLAIVESATFRRGGSQWKLLSGGVAYHSPEGDWSGTLGGFHDPSAFDDVRRSMPLREGTGEALEQLPPEFAERLASREPRAVSALQDVRTYEAARAQAYAAQRVALHVSAFERTLPIRQREDWHDAVAHYLRAWWAINEFDDALFYLAWNVNSILRHRDDLPPLVQSAGDRVSVSTKTLLENAERLHEVMPRRRRQQRRRLKAAAGWAADPARALKRLEELERRFDVLLKRALRQRNATIHGVETVPSVLESIDGFIAQLAAVVTGWTVEAAASQRETSAILEEARATARQMLHDLAQGDQLVIRVLYK